MDWRYRRDPWQEAMDKQRNARIAAARETWPGCSLKSNEPAAKPPVPPPPAALSAWRPLKDAPTNQPAYVETSNGPQVALWDGEWAYWPDQFPRTLSEDTPSLPIADTYELDRAVQGEIARAFGELIQAMVDGELSFSMWWTDEIASCQRDGIQRDAIRNVATILHTAFGVRIPDEVP